MAGDGDEVGGLPWLASVPDGTGTASTARGAIENLKNNIFVRGVI